MMKRPLKIIKHQRGQALIMMLFILLGTWVGLTWVTQLSERSQRQAHIQLVADLATESFAVIASRDLNYKAITNRAMLANSIAIAQLVGLQSYTTMISQTTQNAALITSWVPYLNAVMARISQMMRSLQRTLGTTISNLVNLERILIQLLSQSQLLFHAAASATALQTAQHIVTSADDSLEIVLLNHATLPEFSYLWLMYQNRQSNSGQFINMAQFSRDGFSKRRSYTWFNVGTGVTARLEKWGGTEIVRTATNHMSWQAIDIATLRVRLGPLSSYTVPVGWGGAAVGTRPPAYTPLDGEAFGGAYRGHGGISRQAAMQARVLQPSMMVPLYSSVDSNARLPKITLVVREKDDPYKSFAISRAQLQYTRPRVLWPRRDRLFERANLFNGLWQARLVSISIAEQWLLEQQL